MSYSLPFEIVNALVTPPFSQDIELINHLLNNNKKKFFIKDITAVDKWATKVLPQPSRLAIYNRLACQPNCPTILINKYIQNPHLSESIIHYHPKHISFYLDQLINQIPDFVTNKTIGQLLEQNLTNTQTASVCSKIDQRNSQSYSKLMPIEIRRFCDLWSPYALRLIVKKYFNTADFIDFTADLLEKELPLGLSLLLEINQALVKKYHHKTTFVQKTLSQLALRIGKTPNFSNFCKQNNLILLTLQAKCAPPKTCLTISAAKIIIFRPISLLLCYNKINLQDFIVLISKLFS